MTAKKEKQSEKPSGQAVDAALKSLDALMAKLIVAEAESLDKAFVAEAMLKFEELGKGLAGAAEGIVLSLLGLQAKVYEGFMLDSLHIDDETIHLTRRGTELIKDFLEGKGEDSKLQKEMEDLKGRLEAALGGGGAPPPAEKKVEQKNIPSEPPKEEKKKDVERKPPPEEISGSYPLPVHSEEDALIYTEFIVETVEHIESIENGIMELEKNPGNMDLLNSIFRHFHSVKGAAGFLGILDVGKISHETENLLDLARKEKIYVDKEVVNILLKSTDCQVRLLRRLDARIKHILGKIPESEVGPPFDIVPLLEGIREFIVASKEKKARAPLELGMAPAPRGEEERAGPPGVKGIATTAIKVATEKLDILMELVGELVISHALISQDPVLQKEVNANILKNLSYMGKNTKSIQEQVMAVRMIPLKAMFQKMVRLVRDLGDKTNKKIEFFISGEETEIDKTVIDALNDPLVHLLRNSVDHGIETPEDRRAQGKAETGQIWLKAYNQGGNVVIDVSDDGKGLDRDKIYNKGLEKGLITEDKKLSDREILNLILLPGFSTAEKTTDISGRGVGMDVVVRNISKLNGKLEIYSSEKGKGSTFIIRLPLTMAIIDGMIVQVEKEKYIIPVASIRESIKPAKDDITTVTEGGEVVNVRGKLVPLIRLNRLFRISERKANPWETVVMIVESNGKQRGLMVDNLIGQQQVVIKNLGARLQGIKGISGGAILGDGKVGLILDVEGMMELL